MNNTQTHPYALADFVSELWAAKFAVCIGLVVGVVAAFVFMTAAVEQSKAQIVIAPANPLTAQKVSNVPTSLSGQYQAEPRTENLDFTRFENSYKGVAVAQLLLKNPEITEGLKNDRGFVFETPHQNLSAEQLADYIARRVTLDPVGETSLRSLNYYHADPAFAVSFLQRLHAITDGLLRRDMRVQIDNRIQYLNKALSETRNPDHQRAFADLLLEQERMKMMVSIDQSFAAAVVVPAAIQPRSVWPNAALIYTFFPLVGAFLGFIGFSVFAAFQKPSVVAARQKVDWFKRDNSNNNAPLTGRRKETLRLDDEDTPPMRVRK